MARCIAALACLSGLAGANPYKGREAKDRIIHTTLNGVRELREGVRELAAHDEELEALDEARLGPTYHRCELFPVVLLTH